MQAVARSPSHPRHREPPDIIVSDALMPRMDGFALCRAWMADEKLKLTPFVFYSATYTNPEDEKLALALGAVRYLIKPVEPELFLAALQTVLMEWSARPAPAAAALAEPDFRTLHDGALAHKLDHKMAQLSEANLKLRQSEHNYRQLFEDNPHPMWVCDLETLAFLAVNDAAVATYGYRRDEFMAMTVADIRPAEEMPRLLQSGRHDRSFYQALWNSVLVDGHWRGEVWNRRKNGEIYPEWLAISAVLNEAGRPSHYVGVFSDISQIKQGEEKLEHLAHYDALTQLPNRLLLFSRLEHCIELAKREGSRLALLMLDLDHFKDVNDSFGHLLGDELLQQVALRLGARLRGVDTICRLGGDEFVVLIEQILQDDDAARVATDIIESLSEPWHLSNGAEVRIGASVGISLYPANGQSAQELLQQADTSLCQAEALVRWLDPQEGLIAPIRFIAVAEETGLITPLGNWVLQETCRQGQRWIAAGLPALRLAVNLSAHQFLHSDIGQVVAAALADTGFPAAYLELELTESALMERETEGIEILGRLRSLGVRLAIDDFGTGYSSLAYLKRFPLDILKIDKSFVDHLADNHDKHDDQAIAATIIAMAHTLRLQALAEGVETQEQLDYLRSRGCDMYQGYLTSPPVPAEKFAQLLSRQEGLE